MQQCRCPAFLFADGKLFEACIFQNIQHLVRTFDDDAGYYQVALFLEKFPENAIFNWTYADEQRKKRELIENQSLENPYISLPKLNLYTYQMSEIILDEIKQGIEIDGNTEEFAFDFCIAPYTYVEIVSKPAGLVYAEII